ncbi:MAG: hypothetical protein P1P64_09310 [Treponemataceae bacterium]
MSDEFFLKTTETKLSVEQKIVLNRKGNELFNKGRIEMAAKIFATTGYSDGLNRVGDFFYKKNEKLVALKYYKLANNKHNVDIIIQDLTQVIRTMIE